MKSLSFPGFLRYMSYVVLLSIIIPVFNVERFLSECIESALAQFAPHQKAHCLDAAEGEIILVNDGSTDNSLDVCKRFAEKHKNIRVVNKTNGGVASARNAGLDIACGKYIAFLDGDDCFFPGIMKRVLGIAENNQAEIVSFSARSGKVFTLPSESESKKEKEAVRLFVNGEFQKKNSGKSVVWGNLIRRDILSENQLRFDETMRIFEDWRFWIDFLPHIKKAVSANILGYFYRYNPRSLSHNGKAENLRADWRVWRKTIFPLLHREMQKYEQAGESEIAEAYDRWRRSVILPLFWRAFKDGVPVAEMRGDIDYLQRCGCYPVVSSCHFSPVAKFAQFLFSRRSFFLSVLALRNCWGRSSA